MTRCIRGVQSLNCLLNIVMIEAVMTMNYVSNVRIYATTGNNIT